VFSFYIYLLFFNDLNTWRETPENGFPMLLITNVADAKCSKDAG
jgi:hypothetical protein